MGLIYKLQKALFQFIGDISLLSVPFNYTIMKVFFQLI